MGGCTKSALQTVRTAEILPQNQPPPSIGPSNGTQVTLRWSGPVDPYGKITRYQVIRRTAPRIVRRDTSYSPETIVYETEETDREEYEYTDSGLQPYTRYEYRIKATNSMGSTESSWQVIETAQAPPEGINSPMVSHVPQKFGELRITWNEPVKMNGLLHSYQLQRNNTIPWSFAPEDEKMHTDTGLLAYTFYSYRITACTAGGCTTSPPTTIRTQETAPYFVNPPQLTSAGTTSIRVAWLPPQITNGQIREYRLKVDDNTIYQGLDTSYTVENLTPYQAYTFVLTACTFGGCQDSSSVQGRPEEAPPAGMKIPSLRVTSSTSIEVTWEAPQFPNGLITSYEVRRDGTLVYTTPNLQFTDYEVDPGQQYSYRVTAFNSQGNTVSPAAVATTYSSSPSGMEAPMVEAVSSTSIKAQWQPPLRPNGDIHNYTLYVNSEVVYSSRGLSTTVQGLEFWSQYSVRVEACTANGCAISNPTEVRTLEAPPLGMQAPKLRALADIKGAHDGVSVIWSPPRRPNGVITMYDVFRREYTGLRPDVTGGPRKKIYSGMEEKYDDRDPELKPWTEYEYMVEVFNSMGSFPSLWEKVRTDPAAPESVPAPEIKRTTATTITIEIIEPSKPNGYIEKYKIYLNGEEVTESKSTIIELGDTRPLTPFTTYNISLAACTVNDLCTSSPTISASTLSGRPEGINRFVISNITTNSMKLSWTTPVEPNGQIIRYELSMRTACPYPYADFNDEVQLQCVVGGWLSIYRGLELEHVASNLIPYTTYEFRLQAYNQAGGLEVPPMARETTRPAEPRYLADRPPILTPSGNILRVDWTQSFEINGEVLQFIVYVDQKADYYGYSTVYDIPRTSQYKIYEVRIKLTTVIGSAETPTFKFDPTQTGGPGGVTGGTPTVGPSSSDLPVYQEVWFIALIAILALIILFIGLACCLRRTRHKVPYIRERMPLVAKQKKMGAPLSYCIDPYTGNVVSTEIPAGAVVAPATENGTLPHVGYLNHAYSQMSLPTHSRPGSVLDLNFDKISHKSSRWGDDDDLPDWDPHVPNDSGLHSLAYGEDYDTTSERPISVLKQHTMFTDTHV